MSNKKFIYRTAFVLSIISLLVSAYCFYVVAQTSMRLYILEQKARFAETNIDTIIRARANEARNENKEKE